MRPLVSLHGPLLSARKENHMTCQLHRSPRAKSMARRTSMFAATLFSLVAALSAATVAADERGDVAGNRAGNRDIFGHADSWRSDARLRCESKNARYQLCQVAVRGNVRLVREHSRADCVEGRSWGWSAAGIWVDHGCRGEFTYAPRMAGGYGHGRDDGRSRHDDGRDGGSWGSGGRGGRGELRCESNRGRTVFCPAPVQGNVVLAKQLSHAPCRYGDTWTFDRRGISVREGCRAEFRFQTRGW